MKNPCNNLDKRTNKYKECIKSQEYLDFKEKFDEKNSVGAGDVIEKVTTATGIKKAVEWISGEDCGCDKRKAKANKLRLKLRECPTKDEYEFINHITTRKSKKLTHEEQVKIVSISNKMFSRRQKVSKCGSCYKGTINELSKAIELYR